MLQVRNIWNVKKYYPLEKMHREVCMQGSDDIFRSQILCGGCGNDLAGTFL